MRIQEKSTILLALILLIVTVFLAFTTETSIAQKAQLMPLFSITGSDMAPKLNHPSDVFIDEKHNEIYIVDSGNNRVIIFDMNGLYRYKFTTHSNLTRSNSLIVNDQNEILITTCGKIACYDFRGRLLEYVKLGLSASEKVHATRLRIDNNNNFYVLDGARRVLVFDNDWNFKFAIDNKSLPNIKSEVDRKKQETPVLKSLNIGDICVDDEGMIYLIDFMASRLFVFNDKGKYVRSIGKPGAASESLSLPNGVAIDSQGRVLVVDTTGHSILGYSKNGKLLFVLGGLGKSEGWFCFPMYISTDSSGKIYVVEPALGRVQVLTVKTSS